MQETAEEDGRMNLATGSLSSGGEQSSGPSSLPGNELAIEFQRTPSLRRTQDAVFHKYNRPISRFLVHTRVASLILVVAFALAWVTLRCAFQLGAGRWRGAAFGRSLAAGGGEDEGSSLCSYAPEEQAHAPGPAAPVGYAFDAHRLLGRAALVVKTFQHLTEQAENPLLGVTVYDRHRATTLLLTLIILELSAVTALVGSSLDDMLKSTISLVDQVMLNVSETLLGGRIRNADSKYTRLRVILQKLGKAEHPPPDLPEAERMRRLHELLVLQETAQQQTSVVIQMMKNAFNNVGEIDRNTLDAALKLLTHVAYARKNQVMRDSVLRSWLLENESSRDHSPLIPKSYLRHILNEEQPSFEDLMKQLTDPSLPCATLQKGAPAPEKSPPRVKQQTNQPQPSASATRAPPAAAAATPPPPPPAAAAAEEQQVEGQQLPQSSKRETPGIASPASFCNN
ncbi:uncharacterized protein EMH_0021480 [Eimeria mitis]|uniref:Uncharacterized protein n=1 Tax=Eimeria mitis TaxID=44415 RepID=U6KF84_9EIME|nr:uncharacterized protein EMH_0021480 [Eimeria mitis]CDJ36614.1 hypothetical protein, conserved [Eimeria mitis]